MTRTFLLLSSLIIASPAAANYGDFDTQIAEIKTDVVMISQPLHILADKVASAHICALSHDHIASVPVDFNGSEAVEMACVAE